MQNSFKFIKDFPNLDRFGEDEKYNQKLYTVTLFPYSTFLAKGSVSRVILNFSFRDIDFNKKRTLPFFFAMELLTGQKAVATLSSKNILLWKLRKGMLVGCKVTLRRKNLNEFFDSLALAIPRMEKFKAISTKTLKRSETSLVSLRLAEIVFFFQLELGLGVNSDVKWLDIHFLFNVLTIEEKVFLLRGKRIPVEF
jgi:large subunit ribosomal protein L5